MNDTSNIDAFEKCNYYLDLDDQDELEFNHKLALRYDTIRIPATYSWKGAEWTATLRINQLGFQGFAAITNCSHLPNDWTLRVQYEFTLVPICELPAGMGIPSSPRDTYTFQKPAGDFEDRGLGYICTTEDWIRIKKYFITEDEHVIIKCKYKAVPALFAKPYSGFSSKERLGMVGLENLGATCYLNALLQMLFHVNEFRKNVYSIPFEDEVFNESTTLAMQSVFCNLQLSTTAVTTTDLTRAFGWDSFEAFQQQDVQEMLRVLLDKLEERMKDTPVKGVVKRLFAGKVRSYIRCLNIEYESTREEEFYDIQLDVKGCKSVYDSFHKYVEKEILNGDNKYDAGDDRGKQDAEKGVLFTELPPVLTIHLKRFEFDMQRMGFAKIHDRYEFPLILDLNEFVSPPSASTTIASADGDSKSHTDSAEDAGEPMTSPQVNNVFRLHSVLVHSGDVYGGHYYAYIRPHGSRFWENVANSENQGRWFKFDDEDVFPANRREAVDMCYGDKQTRGFSSAYMLVYIRETEAAEVMAGVEIPSPLIARLEEERAKAQLDAMLRTHNNFIRHVQYFLEEDLAMFHTFTRSEDWVSQASLRTITIGKGVYCYALMLALAKELEVYPHQIEIWKCITSDEKNFRLVEKIPVAAFIRDFDFPFFVRIAQNASNDELMQLSYQQLYEKEQEYLADVRDACTPSALTGKLQFDPCEGMGIGRGTLKIKKMADPQGSELLEKNNALAEEVLATLSKYTEETLETVKLVFFKVFDVENRLPHPCFPLSPRCAVVDKNEAEALYNSKVVYIGASFVDDSEPIEDIRQTVRALLQSCFETAGLDFPDDWQDLYIFEMASNYQIEFILDDDGVRQPEFLSNGSILCCVPGPASNDFDNSESKARIALQNHISHEVSKIPITVTYCRSLPSASPAKYFNRMCGLWTLSGCESPSRSEEDWIVTLSLEQSCVSAAAEVISHLSVNPKRVWVGKEYNNPNGSQHCRSLQAIPQHSLENYFEFFARNRHRHSLQVACLPLDLPGVQEYSSRRYLEFELMDQRMRAQRKFLLENSIYKQARHLYYLQRKDILSMGESSDEGVDVMRLRHIYEDIDWPRGVTPVADEFVSESSLYLMFESDANLTFNDIVKKVRENIIGVYTKEEHGKSGKRTIEMISDSEFDRGQAERIIRSRPDSGLDSGASCIVSLSEMHSNLEACEDVDSCTHEVAERCTWSHLLALAEDEDESSSEPVILAFAIRRHEIFKVYGAKTELSMIWRSWMDALVVENVHVTRVSTIGMQYATREDWSYIQGLRRRNHGIRSMPVEIYCFELYMQDARPIAYPNFPCISYVREDDTIESLTQRISTITGDSDWENVRMAVVCKKRQPHYLSKHSPEVDCTIDSNSVDKHDEDCTVLEFEVVESPRGHPDSRVWDTFAKYYPSFSGDEEWDDGTSWYPRLGLQPPSVKSVGSSEINGRGRRASGGIKIRG